MHALHQAEEIFARVAQTPGPPDAFGFPERRLLLYMSGVHTHLNQPRRAHDVQQQALQLYAEDASIDPALLRIEEAICMARENALQDACQLASTAYLNVLPGHRTLILEVRLRHVLEAIPPRLRAAGPARELREILALPPGQV